MPEQYLSISAVGFSIIDEEAEISDPCLSSASVEFELP